MKNTILLLLLLMFSAGAFSQEIIPEKNMLTGTITIKRKKTNPVPPDKKSIVYFTRRSRIAFGINFELSDNANFLGNIPPSRYLRYVCNPGPHMFKAKGENTFLLEAYLAPGRFYLVDVIPLAGKSYSKVKLIPINGPTASQTNLEQQILTFIKKESAHEIFSEEEDAPTEAFDPQSPKDQKLRTYDITKSPNQDFDTLSSNMYVK